MFFNGEQLCLFKLYLDLSCQDDFVGLECYFTSVLNILEYLIQRQWGWVYFEYNIYFV